MSPSNAGPLEVCVRPDPLEITAGGSLDRALAIAGGDAVPPTSVDALERVWPHGGDDAPDLFGRERDQIRVRAHEAHRPHVRHDRDRVADEQRAATARSSCPMQHGTAIEVTAGLDQRDAGEDIAGASPQGDGRSL